MNYNRSGDSNVAWKKKIKIEIEFYHQFKLVILKLFKKISSLYHHNTLIRFKFKLRLINIQIKRKKTPSKIELYKSQTQTTMFLMISEHTMGLILWYFMYIMLGM